MNLAKPEMWGKLEFTAATTPPFVRKSLAPLDRQLELWASHKNSARDSAFYLVTIIEACQGWEAHKATKLANNPSKNVLKRLGKVQRLKRMAFERLRWEMFQAKKDVGPKAGATPLAPGYQAERSLFLAGKTPRLATANGGGFNPKGASFVHASQVSQLHNGPTDIPPGLVATMTKNFDTLTDQEFEHLHDYFSSPAGALYAGMQRPEVHFARKDERIQHNMLVCMRGLYYRSDGDQRYTTAGLDMYAIDQYGNMMVQPSGAFPVGPKAQYNHSSLNAGNNVICAGTCVFHNGLIQEIDNDSGHYKPGRTQLQALIKVLIDDDMTDLTFTTVKLKTAGAANQFFRGHAITNFYTNINTVGAAV